MTPPAAAAASRTVARTAPGTRRAPVRHPRRISGPAGPARAAAAVAIPAPIVAPPRRRHSRPAVEPRRTPSPKTRRSPQGAPGIALRAVGAIDGLSRSSVLDRLIRGRAWIGLLAFALIGIVTMQLLVLELNTGIGHTLTRVAQLQRANAQLGIENSTSSAESRIAPSAAATGMTLAPIGTVHFVAASPADIGRAAAALSTAIQASVSAPAESMEGANGASGSSEASGAAESSGAGGGSGSTEANSGSSAASAASGTTEVNSGSSAASEAASAASGSTGATGAEVPVTAASTTATTESTSETGGSNGSSSGSGG
jgi:hypothetical protein